MGLMLAVVSVGSVALQSAVNSFGSQVIAAHTAARKIDDIFMLPLGTLSLAASTFASQNYGAGQMQRVKKGITVSVLIAFVWSAVSCAIVFGFGAEIVRLLSGSNDSVVINTAVQYISINIPFFFVLSVLLVLRSSLQGVGRKIIPLSASIIELTAKFIAVGWIAPLLGYFGICILEPIIWSICTVIVVIDFWMFQRKSIKINLQIKEQIYDGI